MLELEARASQDRRHLFLSLGPQTWESEHRPGDPRHRTDATSNDLLKARPEILPLRFRVGITPTITDTETLTLAAAAPSKAKSRQTSNPRPTTHSRRLLKQLTTPLGINRQEPLTHHHTSSQNTANRQTYLPQLHIAKNTVDYTQSFN